MQTPFEALTSQVIKQITPTPEEYAKVAALSRRLEQKIALACQQQGVPAIVRVEGSVAKDTWLRENPDIDVFMRFPTSIPRKNLGEIGLKIAKIAAHDATEIVERFAEHPYLEIVIDDFRVDIVPCYDAKPGEWQSATDRTPYHTDYIKQHLTPQMRGQVRLLKRFMQGVDVYGAEIKVGGFSGYLCELLILTYGSFIQTVQAFADYRKRVVIDLQNHFKGRENELALLFPEPLVIVDPVDKARNVASAVETGKLYSFIGASRAFLKKPSETFFYPPKQPTLTIEDFKRKLDNRGSTVLFLVIDRIRAVPDVLWGQLYRSKRSLRKMLELNDYKVLQDTVWSNEKTQSVFIFELEQQVLANIKKHLGPPLERPVECASFLAKYLDNDKVICGPYIEDGKWIVYVPRKNFDAAALLKEKLGDGGKNVGVSELVAKAFKEGFSVNVNTEIEDVYVKDKEFAAFLIGFLSGKPFWLET
ncbi:MAG: CCA tRNA nucleotidyltransferase [Candidatus Bathyarchaeia archaeon]|jgi:tRNA nucleotidyltransferase (CCA-adding enzyme)